MNFHTSMTWWKHFKIWISMSPTYWKVIERLHFIHISTWLLLAQFLHYIRSSFKAHSRGDHNQQRLNTRLSKTSFMFNYWVSSSSIKRLSSDFPGGPVAKILYSHGRGPGFHPWSGNWIPYAAIKRFHML